MTNKKGFTLIELLVVIAIIGILSAIGLVSLNGAREKARDAQARSDLSTFRAGLALYFDDHGSSYPGTVVVATADKSANHGSATATANSVWDSAGPMVTEYVQALTAPSTTGNTHVYYYGASNFSATSAKPAGHYVVAYLLEGAGGTDYYSVNDGGTVYDTKDAKTTFAQCTPDSSDTSGSGNCNQ